MDCNAEAYERYLAWERERETQDRQVAKGIARTIFYLCVFDAIMTCIHLARGGSELNPLIAKLLLMVGPFWCMTIKLLITTFCLRLLVKYRNHPIDNKALLLVLFGYLGVTVSHLYALHVNYYG